jgi:hypothetical protein
VGIKIAKTRDPFAIEADQVRRQLAADKISHMLDDPSGVIVTLPLKQPSLLKLVRGF